MAPKQLPGRLTRKVTANDSRPKVAPRQTSRAFRFTTEASMTSCPTHARTGSLSSSRQPLSPSTGRMDNTSRTFICSHTPHRKISGEDSTLVPTLVYLSELGHSSTTQAVRVTMRWSSSGQLAVVASLVGRLLTCAQLWFRRLRTRISFDVTTPAQGSSVVLSPLRTGYSRIRGAICQGTTYQCIRGRLQRPCAHERRNGSSLRVTRGWQPHRRPNVVEHGQPYCSKLYTATIAFSSNTVWCSLKLRQRNDAGAVRLKSLLLFHGSPAPSNSSHLSTLLTSSLPPLAFQSRHQTERYATARQAMEAIE